MTCCTNKLRIATDLIQKFADKEATLVVQNRNFGDTLHSSVIVRHYKSLGNKIIWAMSEKFVGEHRLNPYADKIVGLPHACERWGCSYRTRLQKHVDDMFKMVIVPFGKFRKSAFLPDVASMYFDAAGIQKLSVPRRPIFATNNNDKHRSRMLQFDYVFIEHVHTRREWDIEGIRRVMNIIKLPVVYSGSMNDPELPGGIDHRGCTFREAKELIKRAKVFVGCGSGLSMIAASEGIRTPMIEVGVRFTIAASGYRKTISVPENPYRKPDPNRVAEAILNIFHQK